MIGIYSNLCFGQSAVEQDTTEYIISLNDYFNLSADIDTDYERFSIEGDDFKYDIRPNFTYFTKVGIDYRALSVFLSFTPQFAANQDEDLKGSSDLSGFGFSFNTDHLINHFETFNTKGYYIENSEDFIPDFVEGETPYIQLPGLSYRSFRGQHYYKFNPNFSYTAFTFQMARQIKSQGSWATGISWNYYLTENENPMAQDSRNLELLYDVSYYHTYVFDEKWYFNIGAILGLGGTFTSLDTPINGDIINSKYQSFKVRGKGYLGLGYNSQGLFFGTDFRFHHLQQNLAQGTVQEELNGVFFRVFVGYHILAPKFINRTYDKVEEFLGF